MKTDLSCHWSACVSWKKSFRPTSLSVYTGLFIVQKQKIKVIDKGRIVFGKDYIQISDSYKQELQNYVNEHIV